jgi:UDP-2,4-diacetamido-2,4,6-trideoxy-beta-L-altropyranose hydrolase
MVIDDLADRPHNCDLLLDQTLGRTRQDYAGLIEQGTPALTGSQYALLRPEFAQWREFSLARRIKSQFKNLLITMGGVDKDNATGKILDALKTCQLPSGLSITVVMGLQAPWFGHVQAQAAQMPWPTQVLVSVNNMAQLMAGSDLAIGAAGSTSWERCCLGLPVIQLIVADNQKEAAKMISDANAAILLNSVADLEEIIQQFDSEKMQCMAASASIICDGRGAARIVNQLTVQNLTQVAYA